MGRSEMEGWIGWMDRVRVDDLVESGVGRGS